MVISPYQKIQEYLMMRLHGHQSLSKMQGYLMIRLHGHQSLSKKCKDT
jgi:hypothetical protein